MPTRHLRYLFDPASVALTGASDRSGSLGAALTRNLLDGGFKSEFFLVNRRHWRVHQMPAFRHPAALPSAPELALIATPAPTVPKLLAELGRRGTKVAGIASPSRAQGATIRLAEMPPITRSSTDVHSPTTAGSRKSSARRIAVGESALIAAPALRMT